MDEYFNELWEAVLAADSAYGDNYSSSQFKEDLLTEEGFADNMYAWLKSVNSAHTKKYTSKAHEEVIYGTRENQLLSKKYPNLKLTDIKPKEVEEKKKEEKKEVKKEIAEDTLLDDFGVVWDEEGNMLMPGEEGYDEALANQATQEGKQISQDDTYQELVKGKYRWSDGSYHSQPESKISPGQKQQIQGYNQGLTPTSRDESKLYEDIEKDKETEKENVNKVREYFKDGNPYEFDINKTSLNKSQPLKGARTTGGGLFAANKYNLSFPGLDIENAGVNDNFWNPQNIEYLKEKFGAFSNNPAGWDNYLLEQQARAWRIANPTKVVNQKFVNADYPEMFQTAAGEVMTDATYMSSMEKLVYEWFNNSEAGTEYYNGYMSTSADQLQQEYTQSVFNNYFTGETKDKYSQLGVETGEVDPVTNIPYKQLQGAENNAIVAQVSTNLFLENKAWNNVTNQISAGGRFDKSDASEALVIQQEGWGLKHDYDDLINKTTQELFIKAGINTEAGLKAAMLEARRLNPIETWNDGAIEKQNSKHVRFLNSKLGTLANNGAVMIWGFDQETGKQVLISKDSENITDEQLKEATAINDLYESITNGMFTNSHIENALSNLEYELIYALGTLATQGSETYESYEDGEGLHEVTNQLYGGATLYQRGYDAGNIAEQGVLSYFVKEMAESKDIAEFIANASNSGILGELTLLDNPMDNPLINFFNTKLNTYRGLGEAYVINYNPVESLVDQSGEDVAITDDIWKWFKETGKSLAYGISTSKEGLFGIDEYTTEDFQTEFVLSLQSQPELTPYDAKEIAVIKDQYDDKMDVDMAVRVGRTLPTFAAMAVEIAAIELATGGLGTGTIALKSASYAQRVYRAWGVGRKTSKVMSGVGRAFVKESINLHGANYMGSALYGREEMPVYSFAAGSTFAHFGMGAMGRAWKLFGRKMKNSGRSGQPAGKMWNTATNVFEASPSLLTNPLTYAPKKFLQAGMGVGAIKAGEFTSGLLDVAQGELTYEEFWKHITDTDSIIELFGTMLAMGAKSGLKDTSNGIKDIFGDFARLTSPSSTRNFNRLATNDNWGSGSFGLKKKKLFNKKSLLKSWLSEGEWGGDSYWGKLEVDAQKNILLSELGELSSGELKKKYGVESPQEAAKIIENQAKILASKGQIDFYKANQTKIEEAVLGKNSFFGKFNGVMRRYRKNNGALDLRDRLELGEIASFSEYNKVVHEVMSKTGMPELQAQALVKGSMAMAEAVGQLGFKRGSKLEGKFLDISQKQSDITAEKESLKRALEKGDINEANYKLRLEELNELQKEYIEVEKTIIKDNEKSIVEEIKQQEKRMSGNKVVVAQEGKTVEETAAELGLEKYEASEHEYGIQTSKINPKTGKAESIIIIDPAKASKAQKRFFDSSSAKKWRGKITELINAEKEGKISKEVFERQIRKAEKELSKAETKQESGLLESLTKGEARIDRAANREVLFHEEVHPIVEQYVKGPNGKKLVNDFIEALKESGAYEAVWNKLKRHTDVDGNKNYKGSEWFTIFGELAKSGKLNELFKAQKNTRVWDNFASLITKGVREHTALKDYKVSDGLSAIEFIKNFAKGDIKATEAAFKATEEYKEWIADPKNKESLNKSAENAEQDMIDLYEEYKDTWNEGGSMEALKEMAKAGLLTKLIGAQIPYPKPKGWTPKVNDAFIRDVYGEMTQLISGFKASKQTTSGSKGFFAYVNSFLRFKALNVLKEIGVFDKTKSLDEMREEKGFDIKDSGELSSEVYTPKTSKEVSSELKLSDATVKKLDTDLSKLESKQLVEAYDTPAGRNQTISPFIREFKKQYGSLGEKAIAKNMGKNKAEYKKYLENNFLGIINNLPVGYISRNFPYLVEKGTHAGSTGRDTRWTSGPSAVKLKENFSEADVSDFVRDLTEVGRLSTKKNALSYQLADSYGIKKFTEAIENQRSTAERLLTLEGDFELTKNEYAEDRISGEEFDKRKAEYVKVQGALLKESNIMDNINKELSPEQIAMPENTVQKLSQQIEISNFRKAAILNKSLREIAQEFAIEEGVLKEDAYIDAFSKFHEYKPKLVSNLLNRKTGIEFSTKDYREAFEEVYGDVEFLPGIKLDRRTWSKVAKSMRKEITKVDKGYSIQKQRLNKANKNNEKSIEEVKFEIEKQFDRTFSDSKELGNLQKILGFEKPIVASKEIVKEEQLNKMIAHEQNYWINKLNNNSNKAEAIKEIFKYHLGHYATSGGGRGSRGQTFAGKPDVYKEMNNLFKEMGLDIEIKWKENDKGGLKPKSTSIFENGKEVVTGKELANDIFQHQQVAEGKWLKLTDQKWVDKNPEKVEELLLEYENRKLESKDNQNELLNKIQFDYASWKLGKIDKTTFFLTLDQYNTNMQGMLRSSAAIHSVMKPHKGDMIDVLTLEHMRAAQVLIESIATIAERGESWIGLDGNGNKTSNLTDIVNYEFTPKSLEIITELFNKYNTAIITQEKKGYTEGGSVDALINIGHKTKEPTGKNWFGKAGEFYSRLYNQFNLGSENARAMLDLAEFSKTRDVELSLYGKEHEIAARLAKNEFVKNVDKKLVEQIGVLNKSSLRGKTIKDIIEITETTDKALDIARKINPKVKKARVFDFDDTVARTKSKVIATRIEPSKHWETRKVTTEMYGSDRSGRAYKKGRDSEGKINKSRAEDIIYTARQRDQIALKLEDNTPLVREALETLGMTSKSDIRKVRHGKDDKLEGKLKRSLRKEPKFEEKILTAEEFAKHGEKLEAEGWKMDFSEFNKVVDGKKGPLFEVMKTMKEAAGERDMFILTARSQESAPAIRKFLKEMGIDIPLENIKGLGDSSGDAKGEWILGKAEEGYNDFYFADDAIQNVDAVKKVLSQIDVKSKVQQARVNKSSVEMDNMFNKIIEGKTGIGWQKNFSETKGKVRGAKKGRFKLWIPPSAEDFSGLMDMTLGKGKEGEGQREWYGEVLYKPYGRAQKSLSNDRINLMSDFKKLKKELKVPKDLRKITESGYSKEQAVRVHLWNKLGHEVPGISKTDLAELTKIVSEDPTLSSFAEQILNITKGDGYAKPGEQWLAGTITTDFIKLLNTTKRTKYLTEWQNNVDVIFSNKNLNKLEAAYGSKYREALENSLTRMKAGKNRTESGNKLSNKVLDYINNAQGTIMFFNMRSAVLQGLSATNFMNFSFNNPIKMGAAFANQPQYWRDFMEIMNGDYLKDRRNGLKINIAESEIADAAATSKNKAKAAINYILEKGYAPTKFMDSFAIASGGATFYRNRIKSLLKEGKSEAEAKEIAMEEFREISEKTQQSSDPSKISSQQSSDMGRLLLQFVNTPMQYARLQKSAFKDIANGRGNALKSASKILYYGAIQNVWFNFMQQGLFALGFDGELEDEEKEAKIANGINGMSDSILRGLGMGGMTVSVLKNFLMDIYKRSGKKQPKYKESLFKLLDFSPAIKSKFSKLSSVAWMMEDKITKDQMMNEGFSINNPAWKASAKVISATINLPLDRAIQKLENVQFAMEEETEAWQAVFAWLGWPAYQLTDKSTKETKRQKEKDDLHYREALQDPSKYSKEEQVDILTQHGYTEEEIKKMRNEGVRVATIKKAEQDTQEIYTSNIPSTYKPKEEKEYTAYTRDSEVENISDADKKTTANVKKYMNLNKKEQVDKLDSLGYAKWYIRSLTSEQDRVNVLLKDIENDSIPARLKITSAIPKSDRTKQQTTLYDLNKSQQLDTLKSLGISDSLAKSFKYEADRVSKIEELYKERKNEVLPYNYKK